MYVCTCLSVNVDQYDGLHPCPKSSSPLVGKKKLICKLKEMGMKKKINKNKQKKKIKRKKQHKWGKVRQLEVKLILRKSFWKTAAGVKLRDNAKHIKINKIRNLLTWKKKEILSSHSFGNKKKK